MQPGEQSSRASCIYSLCTLPLFKFYPLYINKKLMYFFVSMGLVQNNDLLNFLLLNHPPKLLNCV